MEYTSYEQIDRFDDPHTSKPLYPTKEEKKVLRDTLLTSLFTGRDTITKRTMENEIYLDNEKYDHDRQMEMDMPRKLKVTSLEEERNPFSEQLEATITELDNAYNKLILFPETQYKIVELKQELMNIINSKSL